MGVRLADRMALAYADQLECTQPVQPVEPVVLQASIDASAAPFPLVLPTWSAGLCSRLHCCSAFGADRRSASPTGEALPEFGF